MDSQQFRLLAERRFKSLAEQLGDLDPDLLDVAGGDGMLTLEFNDGAKFMISRQSATNQIWVAAGARAWHYSYNSEKQIWFDDKDGHEMLQNLSDVVGKKLGLDVKLV